MKIRRDSPNIFFFFFFFFKTITRSVSLTIAFFQRRRPVFLKTSRWKELFFLLTVTIVLF